MTCLIYWKTKRDILYLTKERDDIFIFPLLIMKPKSYIQTVKDMAIANMAPPKEFI